MKKKLLCSVSGAVLGWSARSLLVKRAERRREQKRKWQRRTTEQRRKLAELDRELETLRAEAPPPPQTDPVPSPAEEEDAIRRMREDQEAFRLLQHYSVETAYGIGSDVLSAQMHSAGAQGR